MSKSKNVRRKQKNVTMWDRWKLWLSRNEKVLWVVLLLLIAPMFAFTGPVQSFFQQSAANTVQTVYYGEEVTIADLQRVAGFAEALGRIAPLALQTAVGELVLTGSDRTGRDFGFDPYKFCLYRKKAERLGIRVSDAELAERIHDLWREHEAVRLAWEEVLASSDGTNQQQQMFRVYQLRSEKLEELRDRGAFDPESWKTLVRSSRLGLRTFEELLRDLYTVSKLQEYVVSSVKVSPEEVYEEYRKDRQKRLISWVTWTPPSELTEKISASATDEELKAYLEENEAEFLRPLAVRASYVIVPEEHFKAEAEAKLTDEDLEEYYTSHQNDYRTSAILAEEAAFVLRTEEEQEEFHKALFKPLEEVKEEVREKVLETKTRTELNSFANTLPQKLYPAPDSSAKAPTLEELVSEHPFLKTGTTEWATREDAEEVLGDVYTREVNRWFRELDPPPGSQTPARTEVTPQRYPQTIEEGRIFYTNIEVRDEYQPDFEEIAAEVREAYTKTKAIELLGDALEEAIASGGTDVEDAAESPSPESPSPEDRLATLLEKGVEVEVGEEKIAVRPPSEGLVTAVEYVRRHGGLRYVPSESEDTGESGDAEDGEEGASTDEASDSEDDEPKEEVHPSSREICDEAFNLEEKGELAVARNPVEDACYLVRFDDVIHPDPSEFEDHKDYLERRLVQEKLQIYLAEWHRSVLREADPTVAAALESAEEDSPAAAEG